MFAASEAGLNLGASGWMRANSDSWGGQAMPKRGEVDLRKLKYWKAILADFEKSGMTGQSYCSQKGIAYTAFANRRRRLSSSISAVMDRARKVSDDSTACNSAKKVEFAEVTFKTSTPAKPSTANDERLEVVLQTGTILRIPLGFSAAALAEIVTALGV